MNQRIGDNSASALRTRLQIDLSQKLPEAIWEDLVKRKWVRRAVRNDREYLDLKMEARRLLDLVEALHKEPTSMMLPEKRQRRPKNLSAHQHAASYFLANRARQDPVMQRFRSQYVGDEPLTPADVADWLERHKSAGMTARRAVIVKLPLENGANYDVWDGEPITLTKHSVENVASVDAVSYQVASDKWVHAIPVGRDGVLRSLFDVSSDLVKRYGWTEDQATMFVLTDRIPRIEPLRFQLTRRVPLEALSRITIVCDPAVTPREVAQYYKKIRSRILSKRTRRLSEKHAELAMFTLDRQNLDSAAMKAWNRRFPKWSYQRYNRFSKEARVARGRQEALLFSSPVNVFELFRT